MSVREKGTSVADPRRERRKTDEKWRTALTCIEPNKILVRGYPLDEVMGRLTFGEAIYLLFMGEVPSPGIGRLMEAILVSFIDHGATPPSTLAARNTATTGAPHRLITSRMRGIARIGSTLMKGLDGQMITARTSRERSAAVMSACGRASVTPSKASS